MGRKIEFPSPYGKIVAPCRERAHLDPNVFSQVAGAAAGMMEHCAMFPVDTIKVDHATFPPVFLDLPLDQRLQNSFR